MGKSQSKQLMVEPEDENYQRFAFVGFSGSGKSAFVNAVRGIDDADDLAANVDIVEREQQPTEYFYPSNPQASFVDMPGYGTMKYPDIESYWTDLQLGNFSAFIVFLERVTNLDLSFIEKLKLTKKSFFLVRTKIDVVVENMDKPFNEEDVLSKIREDILKQTKEKRVFLISNYEPYKWDFFQIVEAIMNKMPATQIGSTSDLVEQYMADARTHVKKNGVDGIEKFLKQKLDKSTNVKIRFAITGDSGTGKSTYVNAIRGISDGDEGSSAVGVTETTKEPTEYQHPNNPLISFVDLPGIGTPTFPNLSTYCEKVGLEDYDTFLIFTATRFTQYDLELAKKVKSIGKSFFLIRSKIDLDCESKNKMSESEILELVREDCMKNLKNLIASEQDIFLISSHIKDKWDFDRLVTAISDALPIRQRECLTLSLTSVTRECLKRKANFLKAQAVGMATVSAATGAIPVPGVGGFIDAVLIRGAIMTFFRQLGLNDTSSKERDLLDKKYTDIIDRYRSLAGSTKKFVATLVGKSLGVALGIEEVSKYIPIIGIVIASSISFAYTLRYLLKAINELEEAAVAVWDTAAKRSVRTQQNE